MLPKAPGLVGFFGILSLGPLAVGMVLGVGAAVALVDGDFGSAISFGLGSVVFALVGMYDPALHVFPQNHVRSFFTPDVGQQSHRHGGPAGRSQ